MTPLIRGEPKDSYPYRGPISTAGLDQKLDGFKIPWEPIQMGRLWYVYTYPKNPSEPWKKRGCFGYIQ